MAAQQIPQQGIGTSVDIAPLEAQRVQKGGGRNAAGGRKVQHTAIEGIVHHAVPLVTLQEIRRMVPDFSHNQRLGKFCLDGLAEAPPELVGDFIAHIQPPAVHSGLPQPVQRNLGEVGRRSGTAQVQLGHSPVVAEALVILVVRLLTEGKLADIVPVFVGGMLLVRRNVLEGEEFRGGMVENTVQNHPQTPGMSLADQLLQVICRAKGGIDGVVIDGVIFMGGIRAENGGQVENIHSQIPDVIQVGCNALQGAAQIRIPANGGLIPEAVRYRLVVCKARGENLVHHLVGRPVGDAESLLFPQGLGAVKQPLGVRRDFLGKAAVAKKQPLAAAILQLKAVAQTNHMEFHFCLIVVPQTVAGHPLHGNGAAGIFYLQGQVFVTAVECDPAQVVFSGLQTE